MLGSVSAQTMDGKAGAAAQATAKARTNIFRVKRFIGYRRRQRY